MKKRDYRPYCFDSCNEPLKTRHQQLIEAIKNIEIPEVKAKVDEKQLNDAVSKAIKENPVHVDVEVDDKAIVKSIEKDLCKVHAHITCAENEIIETLSCNCDCGGCGKKECECGGCDCKCGSGSGCDCGPKPITKEDLADVVNRVNAHTDRAVESVEVPSIDEIAEKIEEKTRAIDVKIDRIGEDVKEIKEKVEETETKVDDFKALYESYHD